MLNIAIYMFDSCQIFFFWEFWRALWDFDFVLSLLRSKYARIKQSTWEIDLKTLHFTRNVNQVVSGPDRGILPSQNKIKNQPHITT